MEELALSDNPKAEVLRAVTRRLHTITLPLKEHHLKEQLEITSTPLTPFRETDIQELLEAEHIQQSPRRNKLP